MEVYDFSELHTDCWLVRKWRAFVAKMRVRFVA